VNEQRGNDWVVRYLSPVLTPTALFISTSFAVYLTNQDDLGYRPSMVLPFVAAAGITWGLGALLVRAASRPWGRAGLWAYYLVGVAFLVYQQLLGSAPGFGATLYPTLVYGAVWVAVTAICAIRWDPRKAAVVFAAIGMTILAYEVVLFGVTAKHRSPTKLLADCLGLDSHGSHERQATGPENAKLPNIYHFVFDTFHTDMFEYVIPRETANERLKGFIYFPDNAANYALTTSALPSIFLGRLFDPKTQGQREFQLSMFSARTSFLYWLRKAGYTTYAFHQFTPLPDEHLLDYSIAHIRHGRPSPGTRGRKLFRNLWVAATVPEFLSRPLLGKGQFTAFKANSVTYAERVLLSYNAFQNVLAIEDRLPSSGRYTYMHLMIPHDPYVLDADCNPVDPATDTRHPYYEAYPAQYECAGKMILQLVDRLRELGRFDTSMIVIQSDHGLGTAIKGNPEYFGSRRVHDPEIDAKAVWKAWDRSWGLLLVKPPPGPWAVGRFTVSQAETQFLDVAPTILAGAGVTPGVDYPGVSVLDPSRVPKGRDRTFFSPVHFYNRANLSDEEKAKWTEWVIRGDTISRVGVVPLGPNH